MILTLQIENYTRIWGWSSPYENRILVVHAATTQFSGVFYTDFYFSGCHLDVGF